MSAAGAAAAAADRVVGEEPGREGIGAHAGGTFGAWFREEVLLTFFGAIFLA